MASILSLVFILAVSAGNLALGFFLAIYFRQGPDIRRWLPSKAISSGHAAAHDKIAH